MTVVQIKGDQAQAVSPEGQAVSIPLSELIQKVNPPLMSTRGIMLPDGVRWLRPIPGGLVVAHQTSPSVYNLKWIAKESRSKFGSGTRYRSVRIALPYLIVLAVYSERKGRLCLTNRNECFFLNRPLESEDDELRFPALLNCSKFDPDDERPLSWICTQNMDRGEFEEEEDPGRYFRQSLKALLQHLLSTGFNYSSEHHELTSWFSATVKAGVDPRLSSVEEWEKATAKDPLFVFEVPWLSTGRSLKNVADRVSGMLDENRSIKSASDVARLIFNSHRPTRSRELFQVPA